MMSNVVSLQLAKELKEAGWERETVHSWVQNNPDQVNAYLKYTADIEDEIVHGPSPTATELFEELPWRINVAHGQDLEHVKHWIVVTKDGNDGYEAYYKNFEGEEVKNTFAESLPDCLGKAWLTLKEEGLLD